jgi:hypothetical protein
VSGRPSAAWAETILSDRTAPRLTALIEHGMHWESTGCPAHWLLAQIRALPDGSVFLSGYCASNSELEKARGVDVHAALSGWDLIPSPRRSEEFLLRNLHHASRSCSLNRLCACTCARRLQCGPSTVLIGWRNCCSKSTGAC